MAITKILYIGESSRYPSQRLKNAIEYITSPDKTHNNTYVSAVNCLPIGDTAYNQMISTKEHFSKEGRRQGYHIIISFAENEATPDQALEIIGKFVDEYLKPKYEAIYAIHDDTDHIHGHIVFNSVSFLDGKKYRYEKGDWAKYMQPIINRLCAEYGFSTIEIPNELESDEHSLRSQTDYENDKSVWNDMIIRDLDGCVQEASSYDEFLRLLRDRGYEIKQNKYLAVRPPGMRRFRRCHTLGEDYSEQRLRERIQFESVPDMLQGGYTPAQILKVNVPHRLKRTKLSGLQRKYFAKMYRSGRLKKKPYSQAWKYREDIKRFHILQEQYLFLSDYQIQDVATLDAVYKQLKREKRSLASQKTSAYKQRAARRRVYDMLREADSLKSAKEAYAGGDSFFEDEAKRYDELISKMREAHYEPDEVRSLMSESDERIRELKIQSKDNAKKIRTAEALIKELHDEAVRTINREEIIDKTQDDPEQELMTKQIGEEPRMRKEDSYGNKSHVR